MSGWTAHICGANAHTSQSDQAYLRDIILPYVQRTLYYILYFIWYGVCRCEFMCVHEYVWVCECVCVCVCVCVSVCA